jgi:hypothetical protein
MEAIMGYEAHLAIVARPGATKPLGAGWRFVFGRVRIWRLAFERTSSRQVHWNREEHLMRQRLYSVLIAGVCLAIAATPAGAQIPQNEYLRYMPIGDYPTLVRETIASRLFQIYGSPDDPAYRDQAPRDGVDDARAAWLKALGVRFAPLFVRNTSFRPTDFREFSRRASFAINVDTWDLARDEFSFLDHTEIGLAGLADAAPCTAPDTQDSDDCRLLDLLQKFGPRRGPVEPEVSAGAEEERFTVMYFDFPGFDEETWKEAYVAAGGDDMSETLGGTERVFLHPFIAEAPSADGGAPGYELVLQYWFFYPVNDGPNNHEGDWEHINVIVSPLSKVGRPLAAAEMEALLAGSLPGEGDDPLVMRRIDYYFHHFVNIMDFASPNAYQPRADWELEVQELAKGALGERWLWDRARARAWQDEGETRVNTRPVVWIGGDAVGIQSVLEMPGLRDRDGHPSYPFRGYYTQIGPGVGEKVTRAFDHRQYFADPPTTPDYVADYGFPERIALLPDWERLADAALSDPEVRREWAWHLLPIRFGYPASPSPAAGVIAHTDTGNVSVVGPAFNGGWNRTGPASGYGLYDAVKLSWATPLSLQDSFFPRAGFLNAPILLFMLKPPLDLIWRTAALPVRAVAASRAPTFRPGSAPARRLASIEAGMMVSPVSEDFLAGFFDRDQFLEIALRLVLALPPDPQNVKATFLSSTATAPAYSIVFHLSPRFSTESTLASYRAPIGFAISADGLSQPIPVTATLDQFDYQGNLRFNITTGSTQLYVKYGSGITRWQLKNVKVDGETLLFSPDSPTYKPKGNWFSLGFNELVLGTGVDFAPVKVWKTWLGGKVAYSAIHHGLGFEREASVELFPELATELAGKTFSVWRHQLVFLGSVSF